MISAVRTPSSEWRQYRAFAVLSLGAAAVTEVLHRSRSVSFQAYYGGVNPLLAVAVVAVVGAVSLRFLHSNGWFDIYSGRKTLRGALLSALFATILAIPVILVDLTIGFPRDFNVPPPWSLLFYPAIAFVAEVSFHAFPLALLLAVLGPSLRKLNPEILVWSCILLASAIEPIYQVRLGLSHGSFSWADVYVALHVFVFNLLQLYVFRGYGFISMYSFRLVYYVLWHIAWGYARLHLLF